MVGTPETGVLNWRQVDQEKASALLATGTGESWGPAGTGTGVSRTADQTRGARVGQTADRTLGEGVSRTTNTGRGESSSRPAAAGTGAASALQQRPWVAGLLGTFSHASFWGWTGGLPTYG
ncbi:hypothetical protein VZT92_021889 [Zoarces viviparus]|uniref:Uncharacterized protein n=1 Tax=Zoarces viviparus TaxID=48416 RepID=A0AAW1EAE9_ZOAVI